MTIAGLARVVGVALLAAGFALVEIASSAHAQERKNCPDGFFWERMSGQCCVQCVRGEKESLV